MSIKLDLPKVTDLKPRIAVIGVGGAGGNAINNMIAAGLSGVNFIVANTDAQALSASSAEQRIQLGVNLTEGLGAGSKPEIGEAAAEEAIDEIRSHISGSHMVFIAAGMGGGTGTGAATVIARVAKELDILTVGVVTKPFHFEGSRRMRIAEAGIEELRKTVDTLIVIPNQNLFRVANEKTTFAEAFVLADQVLYSGIACIVDLIVKEGLINLDFADVRTIMSGMGTAMMGTGEASGEHRAIRAAEEAISNPLLEDVSLRGAKGLLLSIIGGSNLTLYEVDEAASRVRQEVDAEANIIVGATFDESLGDRVRVSIVASGMSAEAKAASNPPTAYRPASRPQTPPQGQAHSEPHPTTETRGGNYDPRTDSHPTRSKAGPEHLVEELSKAFHDDAEGGAESSKGNAWRGPGDVLIEEGPPQLGPGMSPPPLPPAASQGGKAGSRAPEPFTPGPPVEAKRPPRRMPTVEDFPVVGQREYRAKAGWYESGAASQQRPRPFQPQPETGARGFGILRRITGLARRTEQREPHPEEFSSQQTRSRIDRNPAEHGPDPQQRLPEGSSVDSHSRQQRVEIPVFFHKDRNRQQS